MAQPLSAYIEANDGARMETSKGGKKVKEITAHFDSALGELLQVQLKASGSGKSMKSAEASVIIPEGVEVSWDRKNKLKIVRVPLK